MADAYDPNSLTPILLPAHQFEGSLRSTGDRGLSEDKSLEQSPVEEEEEEGEERKRKRKGEATQSWRGSIFPMGRSRGWQVGEEAIKGSRWADCISPDDLSHGPWALWPLKC